MPQIIVVLLAGTGIWAGYKWLRKEQRRVKASLRDAEDELRRRDEKSISTLKQDPKTGIYGPAD